MKHLWVLSLLFVAACGDDLSTHEGAGNAMADAANEMADVLRTVKDKKSAEAAKPKLEKLSKRMKEIEAAISKLKGEPDAEVQAKVMKALQNFMGAATALPQDPEVMAVLDGIDMGR